MSASEHKASSNQLAPGAIDPKLCDRKEAARRILDTMVNPVSQNQARMNPALLVCRTPTISNSSKMTPVSDTIMINASTYARI